MGKVSTQTIDCTDHRDLVIQWNKKDEIQRNVDMRYFCPDTRYKFECSHMTHTIMTAIEMMVNICLHDYDYHKTHKKTRLAAYLTAKHTNFFSTELLETCAIKKYKKLTYRNILKTTHNIGICPNDNMDDLNIADDYNVSKISQYARIKDTGNSKCDTLRNKKGIIDTLKRTLNKQCPVIGSIPIPYDKKKYCNGIINGNFSPKKYVSVLFIGFIDNFSYDSNGYFIFRSPFGHRWGEKGYGYISYKTMEKKWVNDLWAITKLDINIHVNIIKEPIKFDIGHSDSEDSEESGDDIYA